jgi:hypothetical protein
LPDNSSIKAHTKGLHNSWVSLNPVLCPLQAPDIQELTLRVMDEENMAKAEFIGMAKVPLRHLQPGDVVDKWVDLVPESIIEQRRAGEKHVHER